MQTGSAGSPPLASICINNRNYEKFLVDAIDSALAQDYPNLEVIVGDDFSTDGSRAVIESYGTRIRTLFEPENLGQNRVVSDLVAMARGEVIFLLDSDDVFRPNKVSRMMELYHRHPDAAMLYHRLPNTGGDLADTTEGKPVTSLGDIRDRMIGTNGFWPFQPTSAMALPKRLLDRLMPIPDVESKGDLDLILALVAPVFGPVYALDEPLAMRRLHGANMYSHDERLARREWTLRDNIARTIRGQEVANEIFERLGADVRYAPERHPWISEMRHQLGEISDFALVWSRLRMYPWHGVGGAIRDAWLTMKRSGPVRRRLRRRRRRGKAT